MDAHEPWQAAAISFCSDREDVLLLRSLLEISSCRLRAWLSHNGKLAKLDVR
jgi:hypothetical protein